MLAEGSLKGKTESYVRNELLPDMRAKEEEARAAQAAKDDRRYAEMRGISQAANDLAAAANKIAEEIHKVKDQRSQEYVNNLPRLSELPDDIKEAVQQAKEKFHPEFLKSLKSEAQKLDRPVEDLLAVYFLKRPKYRRRDGLRF